MTFPRTSDTSGMGRYGISDIAFDEATSTFYLAENGVPHLQSWKLGDDKPKTIADGKSHPGLLNSSEPYHRGICVDGAGNLIVVDANRHAIYTLSPKTGFVDFIASRSPAADGAPFFLQEHGSVNKEALDLTRGDLYYITGDRLFRIPGAIAKRAPAGRGASLTDFSELLSSDAPSSLSDLEWTIGKTGSAEEATIKLHRVILGARCPPLLKEDTRASIAAKYSVSAIRALLHYVYSINLPECSIKDIMEIAVRLLCRLDAIPNNRSQPSFCCCP
jgi:hypothetical protein